MFLGGAPRLLWIFSNNLSPMDFRRSCYLGFPIRSGDRSLDMYCVSRAGDPVADMENTFFQVEKREDGIAGEREENPVMEAVRSQFLV